MNKRAAVDEALFSRRRAEKELEALENNLTIVESSLAGTLERQEIARKAAKLVQDSLATRLSVIVTKSLSTVFEEPIEFVAQFVERRGVYECDLFLRIGRHDYDILNGQGGGLADVCSVCLQMAFILMSGTERLLIIDEPARHMDAVAQERFSLVLQGLCRELDFTIIMITHSEAFKSIANRVFKVVKKGGVSHVYS